MRSRVFFSADPLPPWQDVAAEHPVLSLLNVDLSFSSCPKDFPASCLNIEEFFNHSIHIRQRGLVRPKFFLLGDGANAFRDSLALFPWHVKVTLYVEVHYCTSLLKHPRQREGPKVLQR